MWTEEEKELKKQITLRRYKKFPYLIEIDIVFKLIENLTKHNSSSKKDCYNTYCRTHRMLIKPNFCVFDNCTERISSPS